ncbi:phosphotransferase [Actinocorallia longicatena]|uniref:Aminoglycoside phosphotransferase family protein n=1 Tax=Actinocorallia longicatena TaxID=111803 RepID=A0ABP6Q8U8_9ACTN
MSDPWEPEWDVSPSLVGELLAEQFPEVARERIRLLGVGWDNVVYLVGDAWVFRFPRREIALAGVAREIDVLPGLAPSLPLPIPVPELVGTATGRFPRPWWGGRLVPGRELADAAVPEGSREELGVQVGRFLAALHATPPAPGLPADPMGRGDARKRAAMARRTLGSPAVRGVYEADSSIEDLLAAGESHPGGGARTVLSHGDLHLRHLLVGSDGTAAGVIDWGDLCVASPAVDLSLAYAGFTGTARAALLAEYGPLTEDEETTARVLALYLCVTLAGYAEATQRHALLEEAIAGIGRSVTA